MCSAFTPECTYNNSAIIIVGNVYCPNTKFLGKFCLNKKTFQSLGRSDYQCPQCASVCQIGNIPFEDQTNSFFSTLGSVVSFLKGVHNQFKMFGGAYCPGKYCLNREKCVSIGGFVTTPRSIYGCGKSGAWLFLHKVLFTVQEHLKTTKTDKTRFFY